MDRRALYPFFLFLLLLLFSVSCGGRRNSILSDSNGRNPFELGQIGPNQNGSPSFPDFEDLPEGDPNTNAGEDVDFGSFLGNGTLFPPAASSSLLDQLRNLGPPRLAFYGPQFPHFKFGTNLVGAEKKLSFVAVNTGRVPVFGLFLRGVSPPFTAKAENCRWPLNPGRRCVISITFKSGLPGVFRKRAAIEYLDIVSRRVIVAQPLLKLEGTAIDRIVVGTRENTPNMIHLQNSLNGNPVGAISAHQNYNGDLRVAKGDVNGDGVADIITGAGPGAGPHVKVFNGQTGAVLHSFWAFDQNYRGGIYVAAGDINDDGAMDIIVGAGKDSPAHIKVFDGKNRRTLKSFLAFPANVVVEARVASGDVNADGIMDVIVGTGPGAPPHVKAFSGKSDNGLLKSFYAFPTSFTGGIFVASHYFGNDDHADIVVGSGPGMNAQVKVFDGSSNQAIRNLFPYNPFNGGVTVAAGDTNGDGKVDIITGAATGAGPHVKVFNDGQPSELLLSYFAFASSNRNGIFVGF